MRDKNKQREDYKKHGLVQINTWVPFDKKQEILEDCQRLRTEHLMHVGYYLRGDQYAKTRSN